MTREDPLRRIHRLPERALDSREALDAILDAGHHVGTLSTVVDGWPWVVPMLYARDGDRLLMHGSTGAGALRHVSEGAPAALSVFHMDGWIYAHTMFNASARFRSAVVRGHLRDLPADEAADALTLFTEVTTPGRPAEVPDHTRKHLAATKAMVMDIEEDGWTVKVRDGGPTPPEPGEDFDPNLWRGVVPIYSAYGEPEPADGLAEDTPLSPSVLRLLNGS
ncbi:pyridoxamine 5'-phosphate oxidase family protein [Nocardioides sp. WG-D5]